MQIRSLKRVLFSAALLLPGCLSVARASTIIVAGNLGTPPWFDPQNGWSVDGGVDVGQLLAVAFTPASSVGFTDAQLALGIIFSNLGSSPLDVYLASDASGLPGAELTDLSLAPGQTVGQWPPGNLVTYDCTVCPNLNAGSEYWLVVQIRDLGSTYFGSDAAWNWNLSLDYSSGSNFAYNDSGLDTGWLYGPANELRPAFEIQGTALPEPSPFGLVAASILLLALGPIRPWRRKRRLRPGVLRREPASAWALLHARPAYMGYLRGSACGLTCILCGLASSSPMPGQTLPVAGVNYQRVALLKWYPASQTQATFSVGNFPSNVAFDGAYVWVTNTGSNSVTKLHAADGANLGTFPVGSYPVGAAFDGANVWVANAKGNSVTKLSAATGATLGTFKVGSDPEGVAFDGANIWVANLASSSVTEINVSTGATEGTFKVGTSPDALAFDGANIWVANGGSNSVSKINVSTGITEGTFKVGTFPYALAFDGANIWVANVGDDTATKLGAATGAILGTFNVGSNPAGLVFDGANIWVSNEDSNTVTKLRAADGANLGTFAAGSHPIGMAFDGANTWVANSGDGTVSKF